MPAAKRRILVRTVTAAVVIVLVSTILGPAVYAERESGLTSFALIHFAGYLFFLLMPVEALVPFYQAEGHSGAVMIPLAVGTALLAQGIDYWVGRTVSLGAVRKLLGPARYQKFTGLVEQYGGRAIFLFNLFPLSSPNLLLVAGISRFHAGRALLISMLGLTVKYVAIVYVFDALR